MALGCCLLEQLLRGSGGCRAAAAVDHHFRKRNLSIRHVGVSRASVPGPSPLKVGPARFGKRALRCSAAITVRTRLPPALSPICNG